MGTTVTAIELNRASARPPDLRHTCVRGGGWQRFRNTFLQLRFLFPLVIRDRHFDDLLAGRKPTSIPAKLQRLLEKTLWFWPRIVDAVEWSQGADGRLQTPQNYIALDVPAKILLTEVIRYAPDRRSEILDLGCNSGRHLSALYQAGYRMLAGVDAMGAGLERFRAIFPEAAACAKLSHDLFQRFLQRQPDRSCDMIYSHGATIELVHPSFDIVRHMTRIARKHIVLFVHEYGHAYPRMWIHEFRRRGFYLVRAERPAGQFTPVALESSLLVFQRIDVED